LSLCPAEPTKPPPVGKHRLDYRARHIRKPVSPTKSPKQKCMPEAFVGIPGSSLGAETRSGPITAWQSHVDEKSGMA